MKKVNLLQLVLVLLVFASASALWYCGSDDTTTPDAGKGSGSAKK